MSTSMVPKGWTVADLADRFGPIPLSRICFDPCPGTATEQDVAERERRTNRLFELVDGTLVEKAVGFYEAYLAMTLGSLLREFVARRDLGIVVGADGLLRLAPGLVRIPDVAYFSWSRLPNGHVPRDLIPDLVPDLAVEVLSQGNTDREMSRKLIDYFAYGARAVWYVDPPTRSVYVYAAPESCQVLREPQVLSGDTVLPGFEVGLSDLFREPGASAGW